MQMFTSVSSARNHLANRKSVSADSLNLHGALGGAGQLLDSIGGHVNPLQLVQQIPEGMAIPDLRDRLVSISPLLHTVISRMSTNCCCYS